MAAIIERRLSRPGAQARSAAIDLDVYAGEPMVDPEYLELEKMVLLPHIANATMETRDAMGFLAMQAIAAVVGTRDADGSQANLCVS